MSLKTDIARRPLLASVLGIAGLAIIGGGVYEGIHRATHHYPRTPYDDLLYKLADREGARALGAQVLATEKTFDANIAARALRPRLKHAGLADVLEAEIRDGAVTELRGWVIPQTLAQLCALAARVG